MTKEELASLPIVRETISTSMMDKSQHNRIRVHASPDGKYWLIDQRMLNGEELPNNHTIIEVAPAKDGERDTFYEVKQ